MTGRRLALTVFTVFAVAGLGTAAVVEGPAVLATNIKSDYTLSATPTAQTIQSGDDASYTVSVSPLSGFSGTVTLSASKLPVGATACWTSSCNPTASINTSGSVALLVKNAPASTKGAYILTVNGIAGSIKHSVDLSLTVNQPATYAMSLDPSFFTVEPGAAAEFSVVIDRTGGFSGTVNLSASGLPKNATGTFSDAAVSSSDPDPTLTIQTDAKTSAGSYTVTVTGTSTQPTQAAQTTLQVASDKWIPFVISGSVVGLAPGATPTPVDLTLSNPNKTAISVSSLSVAVAATPAGATCAASNFTVTQYSGPLPLAIPAGGTIHLSDSSLAIAQAQWPTVQFTDDPLHSQDACLGTSVTLNYAGSATGV